MWIRSKWYEAVGLEMAVREERSERGGDNRLTKALLNCNQTGSFVTTGVIKQGTNWMNDYGVSEKQLERRQQRYIYNITKLGAQR